MNDFRRIRTLLLLIIAPALLQPAQAVQQDDAQAGPAVQVMLAKTVRPLASPATESQAVPLVDSGHGMAYHGGPIMPFTNVYLIWYGSWAGDTSTTIIPDLITAIGGSSYFSILTTYDDSAGTSILNAVSLAGSTTDNYSQGTQLTNADVAAIVTSAQSIVGADPAGMYIVLTSPDVVETQEGFPNVCGWHSYMSDAYNTKYAWVGNPTSQGPGCIAQDASSPNGNVGADAMANVLVHELDETASDPDLNAWNNGLSAEIADVCNFNFGATFTVPNGSSANVTLGSRNYLIQQVWVNAGDGACGIQLASGLLPNAPASIAPTSSTPIQYTALPINIFWSASTGGAVEWYNVCYSDSGFQKQVCQGSTTTYAAFSQFPFSDLNVFRVQGCNAVGCGGWSPLSAEIYYCGAGEC